MIKKKIQKNTPATFPVDDNCATLAARGHIRYVLILVSALRLHHRRRRLDLRIRLSPCTWHLSTLLHHGQEKRYITRRSTMPSHRPAFLKALPTTNANAASLHSPAVVTPYLPHAHKRGIKSSLPLVYTPNRPHSVPHWPRSRRTLRHCHLLHQRSLGAPPGWAVSSLGFLRQGTTVRGERLAARRHRRRAQRLAAESSRAPVHTGSSFVEFTLTEFLMLPPGLMLAHLLLHAWRKLQIRLPHSAQSHRPDGLFLPFPEAPWPPR